MENTGIAGDCEASGKAGNSASAAIKALACNVRIISENKSKLCALGVVVRLQELESIHWLLTEAPCVDGAARPVCHRSLVPVLCVTKWMPTQMEDRW